MPAKCMYNMGEKKSSSAGRSLAVRKSRHKDCLSEIPPTPDNEAIGIIASLSPPHLPGGKRS